MITSLSARHSMKKGSTRLQHRLNDWRKGSVVGDQVAV
jgi:hypothetical protein